MAVEHRTHLGKRPVQLARSARACERPGCLRGTAHAPPGIRCAKGIRSRDLSARCRALRQLNHMTPPPPQ